MSLILQSLLEARNGNFDSFSFEYQFRLALTNLWEPPLPAGTRHRTLDQASEPDVGQFDISLSLAEEEPTSWSIAFTPTFRKSIADVDRKLQGRVLAALSELSEAPVVVHGDTKKPLVGEFKGLWRFRVGDYRLLYKPQLDKRLVVLVDFGARGGAYE
jgi:mRNA-degrading endonuclease RelE of RelBE toxin-antitoxin system